MSYLGCQCFKRWFFFSSPYWAITHRKKTKKKTRRLRERTRWARGKACSPSSCQTPSERQLSHNSWTDAPPPLSQDVYQLCMSTRRAGPADIQYHLKRQDEAKPNWIPVRPASGIWKCICNVCFFFFFLDLIITHGLNLITSIKEVMFSIVLLGLPARSLGRNYSTDKNTKSSGRAQTCPQEYTGAGPSCGSNPGHLFRCSS